MCRVVYLCSDWDVVQAQCTMFSTLQSATIDLRSVYLAWLVNLVLRTSFECVVFFLDTYSLCTQFVYSGF